MKLPQKAAEGAFMIGNQKFALFASIALIPVDDHDMESAILYRDAEIACITKTDGDGVPFEMEAALVTPKLHHAESLEEAAASVIADLVETGERIINWQKTQEIADPANHAHEGCCGGRCDAAKDTATQEDAIEQAIDSGDADALLDAAEPQTPNNNEPS